MDRDHTADIEALKSALNALRVEKDALQNRLQECVEDVEKNTLSMNRFNLKLIDLENMIKDGFEAIDAKNKENEITMKEMIDEKLKEGINKMEEKLSSVLDRIEKMESNDDEMQKKLEERTKVDEELEAKIDEEKISVVKEIESLRYIKELIIEEQLKRSYMIWTAKLI